MLRRQNMNQDSSAGIKFTALMGQASIESPVLSSRILLPGDNNQKTHQRTLTAKYNKLQSSQNNFQNASVVFNPQLLSELHNNMEHSFQR